MTKKHNIKEEAIIHHVHHKEETEDEYRRAITISGMTTTISIFSNNPEETIDCLSKRAITLYKQVKGIDQHVE